MRRHHASDPRSLAHALESRIFLAVNNLAATADSYVRDGSFAGSNFGTAGELIVKLSGTDFQREGLLKFDLSSVGSNISSAKLRLFGQLQDNRQTNVLTDVYGATAGWTESGVTWNNRPSPTSAKLGTMTVNNASGAWVEVDVTSYMQAEKAAGRNVVALLLRNPATALPYSAFKSKETTTANKPVLVVSDEAAPALPVVGIAASDANASEPGSNMGSFQLTRTGSTSSPLVVTYGVSGSATGGQDYAALPGSVTFAAGSATASIPVNPIDDDDVESAETVTLTLTGAGATYSIDSQNNASSVTIADDDATGGVQVTRVPTADAYVRDGSFAGSNFGGASELVVKKSGSGFNREGFLKFDLSGLTGDVTSAKVRVFGKLQDNSGANVVTDFYGTSTSWTELGITWNNRPGATTAKLGSVTVQNATSQWYEVDVTSFIQAAQGQGSSTVALSMSNPLNAPPFTSFGSRETASSKPQLVLTLNSDEPPPPTGQTPFGGTAAAVPGRIEAERFDEGGEGVAYHDNDPAQQGGEFRTDVGVDIEPTTDGGAGFGIGHVESEEWLEFTVNIASAGYYDLGIRFASGSGGGTAHLEVDDNNVSGPITLPGTGGWENWTTITKSNLTIPQGQHVLRFSFDTSAGGDIGNLNWLELNPSPAPAQPPRWPSSWQTAASAPSARFESAATVVGSKIFVFGGFTSTFAVHRTHMSYDTANNTWANLGTMPATMAESHQGIAADSQFVYIAGGFGGNLNTSQTPTQWISDKVWQYDTITNTFTQIATLPQPRGAGALDLVGRNLHYFGGNPADRVTNVGDHWVYNLDTGVWSSRAPMPDPKDHFSTVVLNGKIYAVGGEHGHDQLHEQESDLDVYDPATDTCISLTSMPIAKSHIEAGTFALDGKIVMAGGQIDHFQPTANVIAYDPNTNSWATLPPLPAARQGAVIRAVGNAVYITLGGTQTNSPQSNTWVGQLPAALSSSPSSASLKPASATTSSSPSVTAGLSAEEILDFLDGESR